MLANEPAVSHAGRVEDPVFAEAVEQAHTWVVGQARADPEFRSRLTAGQAAPLERAGEARGDGYGPASRADAVACWGEQAVVPAAPGLWRRLPGARRRL